MEHSKSARRTKGKHYVENKEINHECIIPIAGFTVGVHCQQISDCPQKSAQADRLGNSLEECLLYKAWDARYARLARSMVVTASWRPFQSPSEALYCDVTSLKYSTRASTSGESVATLAQVRVQIMLWSRSWFLQIFWTKHGFSLWPIYKQDTRCVKDIPMPHPSRRLWCVSK